MRVIDVYQDTVRLNGQDEQKVLSITTPGGGNGSPPTKASITLEVDGPITYHQCKAPGIIRQAEPYDFGDDYRTLVERLTVAVQKAKIPEPLYNTLINGLQMP